MNKFDLLEWLFALEDLEDVDESIGSVAGFVEPMQFGDDATDEH